MEFPLTGSRRVDAAYLADPAQGFFRYSLTPRRHTLRKRIACQNRTSDEGSISSGEGYFAWPLLSLPKFHPLRSPAPYWTETGAPSANASYS